MDGFEIREAEKKTNGTEIKLFLKQDERNYTDSIYLRQIIRTYSDHINYPIVLCLGKAGEETVNSLSHGIGISMAVIIGGILRPRAALSIPGCSIFPERRRMTCFSRIANRG